MGKDTQSSSVVIQGDCIAGLRTLPDASVHCCVTRHRCAPCSRWRRSALEADCDAGKRGHAGTTR